MLHAWAAVLSVKSNPCLQRTLWSWRDSCSHTHFCICDCITPKKVIFLLSDSYPIFKLYPIKLLSFESNTQISSSSLACFRGKRNQELSIFSSSTYLHSVATVFNNTNNLSLLGSRSCFRSFGETHMMYLNNSITTDLGRKIIPEVPQGNFLPNHEISLLFFFFFNYFNHFGLHVLLASIKYSAFYFLIQLSHLTLHSPKAMNSAGTLQAAWRNFSHLISYIRPLLYLLSILW